MRSRFFEETFLLANISIDIALGIPFLTLSNVGVNFTDQEPQWRSYTIVKSLLMIREVDLVGRKEFAAAALNSKNGTFTVYVATSASFSSDVHLFH